MKLRRPPKSRLMIFSGPEIVAASPRAGGFPRLGRAASFPQLLPQGACGAPGAPGAQRTYMPTLVRVRPSCS